MVYGKCFNLFIPDFELLFVIDSGPLLLDHTETIQVELEDGNCFFHA